MHDLMLCATWLIPTGKMLYHVVLKRHDELMMFLIELPAHRPLPHFIPVLVGLWG